MMQSPLFEKIHDLQNINSISKHEQIVFGIINAIDAQILKVDDKLPSINEMVAEIGYARKTIVKAYTELKERGLVESKNLKGYYIISAETNITLKVALVLFAFHSFQEDFYNTVRKELGKRFQIDVFFHHNNLTLFKTIMDNVSKKYGAYIIAPIQEPEVVPLIKAIAPDRLVLVDRFLNLSPEYNYVTQEFEEITYKRLVELSKQLEKYDKFVLFFRNDADLPSGILRAFQKFIQDYNVPGEVHQEYKPKLLKKKTAFFTISDTNLWQILKDARKLEYRIGQDIGILAHDDNVVKEIAFGGITTISTDFKYMAIRAAQFVKDNNTVQEIVPTYLRQRNSL